MSTVHCLRNLLSLDDFEPAAPRMLPRPLFGYISGGVETMSICVPWVDRKRCGEGA